MGLQKQSLWDTLNCSTFTLLRQMQFLIISCSQSINLSSNGKNIVISLQSIPGGVEQIFHCLICHSKCSWLSWSAPLNQEWYDKCNIHGKGPPCHILWTLIWTAVLWYSSQTIWECIVPLSRPAPAPWISPIGLPSNETWRQGFNWITTNPPVTDGLWVLPGRVQLMGGWPPSSSLPPLIILHSLRSKPHGRSVLPDGYFVYPHHYPYNCHQTLLAAQCGHASLNHSQGWQPRSLDPSIT